MIVDCHGHVNWYGYGADALVRNMNEHGIAAMWLLTWETAPQEIEPRFGPVFAPGRCGMTLEDVVEAVARHPARFVPFYAPDPREPASMQRLRWAVEHLGVRGVGELKSRIVLDDPRLLTMLRYAGETGLPVIFHMDAPLPPDQAARDFRYWFCWGWENLERALNLCSQTVLIGHGPGFWREISGDGDASPERYPRGPVAPGGRLWTYMERYPNLYCDLSAESAITALSRDPQVGRRFLEAHSDRCLFGRDFFDDVLHNLIRSFALPHQAYHRIMGENALGLVPL